ncbi:MAG: metal-sensitive transcriptional regulator [Patescibacteria group bacterium]
MINKNKANHGILNRISRIEGQTKGIKKMIEDGDNCLDIITQVMALREASNMLGLEILKNDVCGIKKGKRINEKYLKALFKLK